MHTLGKDRLEGIEKGVSRHHGFDAQPLLVWQLIPKNGLAVPLNARTRDAVIRGLVDLAAAAELVHARDNLIEEIRKREELCSTALVPGVALPHPRNPLPYDIAAGFVVVGLTPGGIPYGAADGSLTRLFFLICCKDERTHLHVLARLARMLHEPASIEELLSAQDAEQLGRVLLRLERQAAGNP
jgi:mannitol/fructose-specific phosphotransferase system IIA component (Ntr-type)